MVIHDRGCEPRRIGGTKSGCIALEFWPRDEWSVSSLWDLLENPLAVLFPCSGTPMWPAVAHWPGSLRIFLTLPSLRFSLANTRSASFSPDTSGESEAERQRERYFRQRSTDSRRVTPTRSVRETRGAAGRRRTSCWAKNLAPKARDSRRGRCRGCCIKACRPIIYTRIYAEPVRDYLSPAAATNTRVSRARPPGRDRGSRG